MVSEWLGRVGRLSFIRGVAAVVISPGVTPWVMDSRVVTRVVGLEFQAKAMVVAEDPDESDLADSIEISGLRNNGTGGRVDGFLRFLGGVVGLGCDGSNAVDVKSITALGTTALGTGIV